MATNRMTTREIADLLMKSLKIFVALAGIWVILDSVADITSVGIIGSAAGIVFVFALLAMAFVLLVATSLLVE